MARNQEPDIEREERDTRRHDSRLDNSRTDTVRNGADEARSAVRQTSDAMRQAGDTMRDAFEPAQAGMAAAAPAFAARLSESRAVARSMIEMQSRLAIAWMDLAWTPVMAMTRVWRDTQNHSGTGTSGPR